MLFRLLLAMCLVGCGARSGLHDFDEFASDSGTDGSVRDASPTDVTVRLDNTVADVPIPVVPCDVSTNLLSSEAAVIQAPSVAFQSSGMTALVTYAVGEPGRIRALPVFAFEPEAFAPATDVERGFGGTLEPLPFGEPGYVLAFQTGEQTLGLATLDQDGRVRDSNMTPFRMRSTRPAFAVTDVNLGLAWNGSVGEIGGLIGPLDRDPSSFSRAGFSPSVSSSPRSPELMRLAYGLRLTEAELESLTPDGESVSSRRYPFGRGAIELVRTVPSPEDFVALAGGTLVELHYEDGVFPFEQEAGGVVDLAAIYHAALDRIFTFVAAEGGAVQTGTINGHYRVDGLDPQSFQIAQARVDRAMEISVVAVDANMVLLVWTQNTLDTHELWGAAITCR